MPIMDNHQHHHNHMPYGYAADKPAVLKRLSRAEGQVRGIAQMVEQDKYCIDILTQISATQAALDKVALELLRDHATHCLTNDSVGHGSTDDKVSELITAIGRMRK
jgi:DNA-binding FrmR family transcriptional regulator